MSGYVPVFDSVFHGTLCGRWPTLPVWLTILPMADKHGHIDLTCQAMSALTGWPIDLLKQAIAELTQPDPESRSEAHEGRRLILIDPDNRQWGWIVVNHEKYREKARLSAKNARESANGINAKRMLDRRRPPLTAADPLSNANANANTIKTPGRKRPSKLPVPEDFKLDSDLSAYVSKTIPDADPIRLFEKFTDQARAAGWTYADWPRAFQGYVRNAAPGSGHFAAGQYPKKSSGSGLEGVQWL